MFFCLFILIDKKIYVNDSFLEITSFRYKSHVQLCLEALNREFVFVLTDAEWSDAQCFFQKFKCRSWRHLECAYRWLQWCFVLVIDSYIWLKIFRFRLGKYQSHSSFNAQLSWRKTLATFSTSLSLETLRMSKIFVRHLSLLVSSTVFWVIQQSFWTSLPSMR